MATTGRLAHPRLLFALAVVGFTSTGCDRGEASSAGDATAQSGVTSPDTSCEVVQTNMPLPAIVRETSGLARGTQDPAVFWTHNDAGNSPEIFGLGAGGELVQQVRVTGAELVDWEDIEAAPCGDGTCLYIGDIGDNDAEREHVTIYRVTEPGAEATETAPAQPLHARFPDGPRDAEALFAGHAGALFLVNKGRSEPVALYRYPSPHRPGEIVTLERVRALFPEPDARGAYVTAATSSPNGRLIGIRTYEALYLYSVEQLLSTDGPDPVRIDLSFLGEAQGEGLALADDGTVWVTSEAGDDDARPLWSQLRCRMPATAEEQVGSDG